MTVHISEIKAGELGDVAGLSKDFAWPDIGMFSVITGRNGSGKSTLLKAIEANYRIKNQHTDVGFALRFIPDKYTLPDTSQYGDQNADTLEIKQFVPKESEKGNAQIKYASSQRFIGAQSDQNVMMWIGRSYEKRKKTDTVFKNAETTLNKFERKFYSNDPWDVIDQMFDRCGIDIRLDRDALNHKMCFVKKIANEEKDISAISQLSSGEKLILALSLWKYVSIKADKDDAVPTQILLLDEFDAHLNPCLMKDFVDLLKENFVAKGVQVIMTTHSPTTLAYANKVGADIKWMKDGEVDESKCVSEIITELSSGIISNFLEDVQKALALGISQKFLVITEGKNDPVHLEAAIKIFGENNKFKDVKFLGVTGGETVIKFADLSFGQRKTLMLFDNDSKWYCAVTGVEKSVKEKCKEKSEKFCYLLCDEKKQNSELEDLYDDDFLKESGNFDEVKKRYRGDKTRFSAKMKKIVDEVIDSKDHKKIADAKKKFKNFEPLLTQILQAFETETKKS